MKQIEKSPAEVLKYTYDFGPLLASGETVSTQSVTFSEANTITAGTPTETDGKVTVELSGGLEGQTTNVIFQITTSAGNTFERIWPAIVRYRTT